MIKKEGLGWRLAKDASRGKYSVLIAGADWAVELTEDEGSILFKVIQKIIAELNLIESQLMDDEPINIEMEKSMWRVFLKGDKTKWSLKLILLGDGINKRGAEVFWPDIVAQSVTNAMKMIWDSDQIKRLN